MRHLNKGTLHIQPTLSELQLKTLSVLTYQITSAMTCTLFPLQFCMFIQITCSTCRCGRIRVMRGQRCISSSHTHTFITYSTCCWHSRMQASYWCTAQASAWQFVLPHSISSSLTTCNSALMVVVLQAWLRVCLLHGWMNIFTYVCIVYVYTFACNLACVLVYVCT